VIYQEGVETGWQAPHWGEGTVQPTNPKGAAKAEVGGITAWSQVRILPGPSLKIITVCPNTLFGQTVIRLIKNEL